MGQYDGMAIQIAAGTESWELANRMTEYNITIIAPSSNTVGAAGGWLNGGGHCFITSLYGLGSDQVLSINVVTADGRLITADPFTNTDLFFALRGGAGSTFGIVTSVVMKAYPFINVTYTEVSFSFNPTPPPSNDTIPPGYYVKDIETFWKGTSSYYLFAKKIVDTGGIGFTYIYPLGNNTYSFRGRSFFPVKTLQEIFDFMQPLYDDLNSVGIETPNVKPTPYAYNGPRTGVGDVPLNTRYASRLFPRTHWEDPQLFDKSMAAIRQATEAAYVFHGTLNGPSKEIAGWPGRESAVNPAWRVSVLHAMLLYKDTTSVQTAQQARDAEADINRYVDVWRELTPGSGAYINEADPAEPNWQQSFFGDNYARLLDIKRARDPWGVFWALTTVGSEGWEVRTKDGYPHSENGRLCRVS
jgi:FAD/FMN-containing dehydrogenase